MPVRIHLAPKTDLRHHTTRPHRPASHFDQLLHWGHLQQNLLLAFSAFKPLFSFLPVLPTDDSVVSEDGARKRGFKQHHLLE